MSPNRSVPSSAVDTMKEYASFGFPIVEIKSQMLKDGFSTPDIESAEQTLKTDGHWRDYLLQAISQLNKQGHSADNIVKLLGISDEEYNAHLAFITAAENSLSKKDKLLVLADRLDKSAQLLERLIPRFLKQKPHKNFEMPEDAQEESPGTTIAVMLERAKSLLYDITDTQAEIATLKSKHKQELMPLNEKITEYSQTQERIAESLVDAIEEEEGALDAGERVVRKHASVLMDIQKIMTKGVSSRPGDREQLDFVLDLVAKNDAKLFSEIARMLSEFVATNTKIEETMDTIVTVFPMSDATKKQLRGVTKKYSQWWTGVLSWVKDFVGKVQKFIEDLSDIDDDIDKTSGIVGELLTLTAQDNLRESVRKVTEN